MESRTELTGDEAEDVVVVEDAVVAVTIDTVVEAGLVLESEAPPV